MIASVIAQYSNSEIFYSVNNALPPYIIYKYDFMKQDEGPIVISNETWSGFDASQYDVEETTYFNKGPTLGSVEVPMSIIKRKNMKGPKPCLLYGYGMF